MIVKNEAPRIENAIELARRLADEVVVYDTGSDDDTVALARAAGAIVRCGFWDSDFARARNEAIAMVRGDWVLILDGDDELVADAASAAALRSLLPKLENHHAIMLTVRNLVSAATGETDTPVRSRRLFSRNLRYVNRVHEVPKLRDGGEPTDLSADQVWIRHTGYTGDHSFIYFE
jgi:glycosyltransferase involved in cell wall biosynthesis